MKLRYLTFIALIFFTTNACEDLVVEEQLGCLSGIFPGTNTRQYIFCITRTEYATSGNTFNGITYDNVIWTEIDNCDECLTLDYSSL
ncbi:MAG: hypothetical protein AAGI07_15330 [Bacteroidota bacterium]